MFLLDSVVGFSASDLTEAASCEFAAARKLDGLLRHDKHTTPTDKMMDRTAELGLAHEKRVLAQLREGDGGGVAPSFVEIEFPRVWTYDELLSKHAQTVAALNAGTDIVYQGTFFDGTFYGRADFLVRLEDGYQVVDTKLARSTKIPALLQIAAYADQLIKAGLSTSKQIRLIRGDGTSDFHDIAEIRAVYLDRRRRFEEMIADRHLATSEIEWNSAEYVACGSCDICAVEVLAHDDLRRVAKMTMAQRRKLMACGIRTMHELASRQDIDAKIPERTLKTLQAQALLQCRNLTGDTGTDVLYDVFNPAVLAELPPPDAGDIYFDFEGDPLWAENDSPVWGLEYLFGVVERIEGLPEAEVGEFKPFWAHTRAEEKRALQDFLAYVEARRARYPNMHIYHYAPYETTALKRLSLRHGTGEDSVDNLLRQGVFVDLYGVVRSSLRVSQPSYSIKKLEPLYMGDELRNEDGVTNAADSIVGYHEYCEMRDGGDTVGALTRLSEIGDYNFYDCKSTLKLHRWLLERAADAGIASTFDPSKSDISAIEATSETTETTELAEALLSAAGEGKRSDINQAIAMAGAALGYHAREDKPVWWAHYARLIQPPDEWMDERGSLVADRGAEIHEDWNVPKGARTQKRIVKLTGTRAPGSNLAVADDMYALYDNPVEPMKVGANGGRGWIGAKITQIEPGTDGIDVVYIQESVGKDADPFDTLPMAVTPGAPLPTTSQRAAIRALAQQVSEVMPDLPAQPAIDILARRPPRLRGDASLPAVAESPDGYITAITDAVKLLDNSYLAVQGPPGTGKTYVGSRVIATLVAQGWKIGVVAQSHAAVENVLEAVVSAGVPASQIAKKIKGTKPVPWQQPDKAPEWAKFIHLQQGGWVMGGTAWDLTSEKKIPPGTLDLLVIDEAGQYSLANTLAVSRATQRLLLLGDPAQLPQVSQGIHPEPVDLSALGWLADGQRVLPDRYGYFLETSWRMHPALCTSVSDLSYDGKLSSEHSASDRKLEGVRPGVQIKSVLHEGNSVVSSEEAAKVLRQVQLLLGRDWTSALGAPPRPLEESDFLVVAPYNAQVACIKKVLSEAKYPHIPVGTVDKFQGQEAPVVIVSMTASAADDVPRGIDFLLSRNRLNVAISRGQWSAIIIASPGLTDFLPTTPAGLGELGAFLTLCRSARGGTDGEAT
ncbi:TM0106 family RecB-like putative nuclease [Nakamurella antarctica]|uniref:TM0106 family RecB-like putative nuclease n=1 Tax=Nakamurella antarctica TaxID=1902245 RepID=A0A3G8ZIR2_9ACTN|nr:bifunctional RecB family nuclease/DEAD/DEAH box helicase [Nakamurella antarctica]AZI57100.1 TM0106 family RecB-like putative nuclease [Nakamurella antarctica]